MKLPGWLLVADRGGLPEGEALGAAVAAAVAGGCPWVLWRDRGAPEALRVQETRLLAGAAAADLTISAAGAALARAVPGTGLHLAARELAAAAPKSPARPFGTSVHDVAELERAIAAGADYALVGTTFPTRSKPGRPTLGPEGLRALTAQAADRIPLYAIGGISWKTVQVVRRSGCAGFAVCSAVLGATDPTAAARVLADVAGSLDRGWTGGRYSD